MNAQQDRPDAEDTEQDTPQVAVEPDQADDVDGDEDAALAELKALADANWEKYLRAAAEVENVRKRASRDVEEAHKFALARFCTELLAVRDSLEAGLASADQADVDTLLAGKEATLKLLSATMERFGVEELNPEGEPFDPEEHEAMSMQPSPGHEPGSVLTVFQKGYTLNGRLLRPARVVVTAEPEPAEGDAAE